MVTGIPRINSAAAEEYVASLYATVLQRDPGPDEFANWMPAAEAWPAADVYLAFINSEECKRLQRKSMLTSEGVSAEKEANGEFLSNTSSNEGESYSDLPNFGRSISFGRRGHSEEIIGAGWSIPEDACRWMTGSVSLLALPVPPESNAADFILMLRVTPYTADGQIDGQRCTVVCGAETVAEVKLVTPSWIGIRISAEAAVAEKFVILFVHPDAESPQKFGISPDSRELAIAVHEAVLLPVGADDLTGRRGRSGQFVSSDWRAQAVVPDWKKVAFAFQSMGQDCEFGLVQRQFDAEPQGLFRFANIRVRGLVQCLWNDFSEITDEETLCFDKVHCGEYLGEYKSLEFLHHTMVLADDYPVGDALRRKVSTRLKMLVRLFREDLEDGEKVFVLLGKDDPLSEFEVLPVISLMRRYNPKAALLWITVAGPDERHLVGQCEIIGNNLLKGYLDRFSAPVADWNKLPLECWKDIMVSALEALGRPIPTQVQVLPPEQEQLADIGESPIQLPGVEPLSRRPWIFGRGDGVVYSRNFELHDDGTIGGYDHPNERRWREENGAIVLTRDDGTITCVLQPQEPTPLGEEVYSGQFLLPHPGPPGTHVLTRPRQK
jgi:hypothetical protein